MWITSDEQYRALAIRLRAQLGPSVAVHYLPEVESTSSWLKDCCARESAFTGLVVYTRHQTAGRGTRGRTWLQLPGRDVALSAAVLLPRAAKVDPRLSLVAGAAAATTLEHRFGRRFKVKWPNDILLATGDGLPELRWRKVAGLLLETSAAVDGRRVLACGIGVNANSLPQDYPEELRSRLTSLAAVQHSPVDICALTADLAGALLAALAAAGSEKHRRLAEWQERDATPGTRYTLCRDGRTVVVTALRLRTSTGALLVADAAGHEYTVNSYTELDYAPPDAY